MGRRGGKRLKAQQARLRYSRAGQGTGAGRGSNMDRSKSLLTMPSSSSASPHKTKPWWTSASFHGKDTDAGQSSVRQVGSGALGDSGGRSPVGQASEARGKAATGHGAASR